MTSSKPRNSSFPLLGVLGAIVFILAGLAAFFHFGTGISFALIFIIAGAAVVLVGIAGFKTRGWDIAIFIIALIVFAGVLSTNYNLPYRSTVYSYSVTPAQLSVSRIEVLANSAIGSIDVRFSQNADLAYQVVFQNTYYGFPFVNVPLSDYSLENETRSGTFYLNATSSGASITITLGIGYAVRINAMTSVGSIRLNTPSSEVTNVQHVSLSTSTGSIEAHLDSQNISGIVLRTGTGSVTLASNYLSPSTALAPISVSSGTGSANIDIKVANNAAMRVNATTNLGSISQILPGFEISQHTSSHLVASVGNLNTAERSLMLITTVGTGSISIKVQLVSPES